jgi:hypothetical protein
VVGWAVAIILLKQIDFSKRSNSYRLLMRRLLGRRKEAGAEERDEVTETLSFALRSLDKTRNGTTHNSNQAAESEASKITCARPVWLFLKKNRILMIKKMVLIEVVQATGSQWSTRIPA